MEAYIIQLFSVVLNVIILYGFNRYISRQHDSEKKQQAIENGLKSLLRDRIVQSCVHNMKQGYVLLEDMNNITEMFNAYKNLGGNGVTEEIYQRFLKLPSTSFYEHINSHNININEQS